MNPRVRTVDWRRFGWFSLAGYVLVALVVTACQTSRVAPEDVPTVTGATFVGNDACLSCHESINQEFLGSPHGRIHLTDQSRTLEASCEACHGPGSRHVQAGGGRGVFIVNPGQEPAACFVCHQSTHAEFRLPHHHPVLEGELNCVQCHDPHGGDIFKPAGGLAFARQDESCAACHRDQSRPFVFEHEALREGCTTCHQPHGSVNDKMLVARDNNLCLRCHAQIANPAAASGTINIGVMDHSAFLSRGTCWSSGCHTAVHGSNADSKLRF